ncbi:hypothetical protein QQZ08_000743 [Neonectria magnoliae]|uniref:Arylamine N-acetyltransferase n=1 Tax=Neonectria magnoliae TaxID=2732573 RepID=A0ABR1IFY1_9HYPO
MTSVSAYCSEQLQQFFAHIELPEHFRHEAPSLSLLQTLHTHCLSTLPYENLSLHYNATHQIELDPQHLFRKMSGRVGDFKAFHEETIPDGSGHSTQLKDSATDFAYRNHIVNIVTFPDGSKYHTDVAFGGDGALFPMVLVDGLVYQNLGTQQIRLVRDWIPHQVHRTEDSRLWIYQYRNGVDKDWNSFYSFPGIEFYALDWGVVNFWIGNHPSSHQRVNMLVIKFLRRLKEAAEGEREEYEIYGKRMLVDGVIKENLGGKTQVIAECKSEAERLEALEKYFSISLEVEEKEGIRGYVSELW